MKVYSSLEALSLQNPVVTIGMFDGVHLGHKVLLQQVIDRATAIDGNAVVVSFWPHPRIVLGHDASSLRFLSSLEEKTKMMSEMGIDALVLLPFTTELSQFSAEEFVLKVLVEKIGMKHLVVGFNHRFGKGRTHSFEEYHLFGNKYGFGLSKTLPVEVDGINISSTVIRSLLEDGNVTKANRFLGYEYTLIGTVVGGQRMGRTLGYPTANILPEEQTKLVPPNGVYACKVNLEGQTFFGMLNVGYRPTIEQQSDHRTIEVHIFDFYNDIYSEVVGIVFVTKIREEQKFNSIEELKKQLLMDEELVRALFLVR